MRWPQALAAKGLGEKKVTWRLRDWGVSRQRYWGTPIPIIHCDEHGAVPVPEQDLPVVLPRDCVPDGIGQPACTSTQVSMPAWSAPCAASQRGARPTPWTPSSTASWYFMRYCDPNNTDKMVADGAQYWMPHGPVHRWHRTRHPAPAVCALLDQGDARPGVGDGRRTLHPVAHPGHGAQPRLLAQGPRRVAKKYFWPQDVEHVVDETGKVMGAKLTKAVGDLPVGTAIDYEGVGTMSKSQKQRRRSRKT